MSEKISIVETMARRRSVVTAAAWCGQVIAMAVAAPAASASGETYLPKDMYTLSATISSPTGPDNAWTRGVNSWLLHAKRSLNYSIEYRNNGPATMPAGSTFQVYMPVYSTSTNSGSEAGPMWETLAVTTLDAVTFSTPVVTDGIIDTNGFQWKIYTFTLNVPLVAGQTFTVNGVMSAGTKTAKPDHGAADFNINIVTRISSGTAFCDGRTSVADTMDVAGASIILSFQ